MGAAVLLLLVTLQLLLGGASAATEYMRAAPCGADGSGARIGVLRNGTIAVATDCVGITRGVQWDQTLATVSAPSFASCCNRATLLLTIAISLPSMHTRKQTPAGCMAGLAPFGDSVHGRSQ